MSAIKAVIKLEVNGDRPASIAKKMGVGMLKAIMPFKCINKNFKHSASQNKSKAMQIAVGFDRVTSAGLEGEGMEELVVKGVFDPVKLVAELREKVGGASIKSVGPEEDKKEKEKKDKEKKEQEEREKLAKIISSSSVYPYWSHHQPLIYEEIPSRGGCFF